MCNPVTGDAASNDGVAGATKKWRGDRSRSDVDVGERGGEMGALSRMTPRILFGYLLNTVLYLALSRGPFLPSNVSVASRYCTNAMTSSSSSSSPGANDAGDLPSSCTRPDLLAFQIVSFLNLSYLGLNGMHAFFVTRRPRLALPKTPQGRILQRGSLHEADVINSAIVVFQGWDFVMSCMFVEHRVIVMLVHHFLAFVCGYFSLMYEVLPYYAVYFGGVCEFSSIFLCISDFFQVHPPSSFAHLSTSLSSVLPNIEILSQATFVLTFFAFRIVGWAYMSTMFISDAYHVIGSGLLKTYRPGSGWFLWYMMTMSALLGALQVYWLKAILDKVSEILE